MSPDRDNEHHEGFRIGPGGSTPPRDDHHDAWDDPDDLLEQARLRIRAQDEQNREGVKLARRLIVAFVLIMILGVVFYAVLPQYNLRLPPIVPALSFIAIVAGAILTARDQDTPE